MIAPKHIVKVAACRDTMVALTAPGELWQRTCGDPNRWGRVEVDDEMGPIDDAAVYDTRDPDDFPTYRIVVVTRAGQIWEFAMDARSYSFRWMRA